MHSAKDLEKIFLESLEQKNSLSKTIDAYIKLHSSKSVDIDRLMMPRKSISEKDSHLNVKNAINAINKCTPAHPHSSGIINTSTDYWEKIENPHNKLFGDTQKKIVGKNTKNWDPSSKKELLENKRKIKSINYRKDQQKMKHVKFSVNKSRLYVENNFLKSKEIFQKEFLEGKMTEEELNLKMESFYLARMAYFSARKRIPKYLNLSDLTLITNDIMENMQRSNIKIKPLDKNEAFYAHNWSLMSIADLRNANKKINTTTTAEQITSNENLQQFKSNSLHRRGRLGSDIQDRRSTNYHTKNKNSNHNLIMALSQEIFMPKSRKHNIDTLGSKLREFEHEHENECMPEPITDSQTNIPNNESAPSKSVTINREKHILYTEGELEHSPQKKNNFFLNKKSTLFRDPSKQDLKNQSVKNGQSNIGSLNFSEAGKLPIKIPQHKNTISSTDIVFKHDPVAEEKAESEKDRKSKAFKSKLIPLNTKNQNFFSDALSMKRVSVLKVIKNDLGITHSTFLKVQKITSQSVDSKIEKYKNMDTKKIHNLQEYARPSDQKRIMEQVSPPPEEVNLIFDEHGKVIVQENHNIHDFLTKMKVARAHSYRSKKQIIPKPAVFKPVSKKKNSNVMSKNNKRPLAADIEQTPEFEHFLINFIYGIISLDSKQQISLLSALNNQSSGHNNSNNANSNGNSSAGVYIMSTVNLNN